MFSLTTPRGDQIRQSVDEKQNLLSVTATDVEGNYQLAAGGETGGAHLGFSVNLPAEVSQLERVDAAELKTLFGETPFRLARSRDEIDRSVSVGRTGSELYPYLIVLLAALLGLEQFLANRFYRQDLAPSDGRAAKATLAATTVAKAAAQAATERPASRPDASATENSPPPEEASELTAAAP